MCLHTDSKPYSNVFIILFESEHNFVTITDGISRGRVFSLVFFVAPVLGRFDGDLRLGPLPVTPCHGPKTFVVSVLTFEVE